MTKAPEQYDAHIIARAALLDAALRAALPAEPSREIVETMARALWGGEGERFKAMLWEAYCEGARSAYLALRAHLLGEDPSL